MSFDQKNISKHRAEIIKKIEQGNVTDAIDKGHLVEKESGDPGYFAKGLIERMCWAYWRADDKKIKSWEEFSSQEFVTAEFEFLKQYVNAYSNLYRCIPEEIGLGKAKNKKEFFKKFDIKNVHCDQVYGILNRFNSCVKDSTPALLLKAQVESSVNRENASKIFNDISGDDFLKKLSFEKGMSTFFSENTFHESDEKNIFSSGHFWIRVSGCQDNKNPLLLLSCDEHYFKRLSPFLALEHMAYPDIDIHVIIAEGKEKAEELITIYDELEKSIYKMGSRTNILSKIGFSYFEPPEYKSKKNTFSACVRYGVASQVMDFYKKSVFIMDADMLVEKPPYAFFDAISKHDFSCPVSKGLMSIVPWRRFIANSFYVARNQAGSDFLKLAEQYISVGFSKGGEWYLDQNSLDYAYSELSISTRGTLIDSNSLDRPILSKGIYKSLLV